MRPPRILNVIHHPGRVWMRTYATDKALHVRVTDCEHGEWDGSKTVLAFYPKDGHWQGHIWNDPARITLNPRQAQAMFDGMFDWLIDWWSK